MVTRELVLRLFPSSSSTAHQPPRLSRRPTIKSVRSGIYNIAQLVSATPRGPVAANRLSTPPPDQLEHDRLTNPQRNTGCASLYVSLRYTTIALCSTPPNATTTATRRMLDLVVQSERTIANRLFRRT